MNDCCDIAWLAGFYEGEGSICLARRRKPGVDRLYFHISIQIAQLDREPLERAQGIVGRFLDREPTIFGPYASRSGQSMLQITTYEDVRTFTEQIRPYLSARRRAQIDKALGTFEEYRTTLRYPRKGARKRAVV